jgi:hypothetical protein
VSSCFPDAAAVLRLGLEFRCCIPCLFPYARVLRVVKGGTVSQLFDGAGKVPWGFTIVLDPSFPLIAGAYGQLLVPKSVFSCSDSLLARCSFRGSLREEHQKPVPVVFCSTYSNIMASRSLYLALRLTAITKEPFELRM